MSWLKPPPGRHYEGSLADRGHCLGPQLLKRRTGLLLTTHCWKYFHLTFNLGLILFQQWIIIDWWNIHLNTGSNHKIIVLRINFTTRTILAVCRRAVFTGSAFRELWGELCCVFDREAINKISFCQDNHLTFVKQPDKQNKIYFSLLILYFCYIALKQTINKIQQTYSMSFLNKSMLLVLHHF